MQSYATMDTGRRHRCAHVKQSFMRFYFKKCPLADECSQQSWKKTHGCESYESAFDARDSLWKHLTNSGYHYKRSYQNLLDTVRSATVAEEKIPGHNFPKGPPGPPVPDDDDEEVDSPLRLLETDFPELSLQSG